MAKRRIDGFFYGLFMDGEVLKGHSVCCVPVPVTRPVPYSLAPRCGRVAWALGAG